MTYAVARFYSGSGSLDPEEIDNVVRQELMPQLMKATGLHRYSTIKFKDGRIGPYSMYESQDAANRGQQIAIEWVHGTGVLRGYTLTEVLRGEVIHALQGRGNQLQRNAYAVARIYKSAASVQEVRNALDQEGSAIIQAIPGILHWACVRLEDGRSGVFSACETLEAANQLAESARKSRTTRGSAMGRIFPNEPETMDGLILGTYCS